MASPGSSRAVALPSDDAPTPLRLRGGTVGALAATVGALWENLLPLFLFNLLWSVAALTVVALPPATAALFAVARAALQQRPVTWETFRTVFRRDLAASWRWALAVGGVVGVAALNLWLYRGADGALWSVLRVVWALVLAGGALLNLFFWPFWHEQAPQARTLRVTWRNNLTFLLARPLPVLAGLGIVLLALALTPVASFALPAVLPAALALALTALLAAHLPEPPA